MIILSHVVKPGDRNRLVFVGLCAVVVGWTAVMSVLEPILWDGWFIEHWLRGDGGVTDYWVGNWNGDFFWGNPRLGQMTTVLTYGSRTFHAAFTPAIVLAFVLLLVTHARGRWPRSSDAWLLAVILGLTVLAQSQLGPLLFYRPFTDNYVVGLVIQLAWLVPFRFALERPPRGRRSIAAAAGMLVLGIAAGAAGEHTGPVAIVAGIALVVRFARRRRLAAWMIAGVVGVCAGYAAMMLAPAQAVRYCGVATEVPLVERIAERGVLGNLEIVVGLLWAGRWMWVGLIVAAIALRITRGSRVSASADRRPAAIWIGVGVAGSLLMIVSPKQGERLLAASLALSTIGVAVLLDRLAGPRARKAIAAIACAIVAVAVVWSVSIYIRASTDHAARRAVLAAAAPGTIASVPPLRDGQSRWSLGDDFRSDVLRHWVAKQVYGLDAIDLAGYPTIPYQFDLVEASVPRDGFLPLHLCQAREILDASTAATAVLGLVTRTPLLDGRRVVVAERIAGRTIAPSARVIRDGTTRYVSLDRHGLDGAVDILLIGPDRRIEKLPRDGDRWTYKPWTVGNYLVLACPADRNDLCYLAEAARHPKL